MLPIRTAIRLESGSSPMRSAIDVLVEEIDDPVDQHHLHVDVRVGLEEFGYHRDDMQAPEYDGRGDDQLAARRAVFAGGRALDLGDIVEDPPAGLEILPPGVGERHPPGRAGKQLHPEALLELGDLPADGRQRHAEATRGGGEAWGLRHRGKYGHRFESVHDCSILRNKHSKRCRIVLPNGRCHFPPMQN
jgi:hypothetical protein